MAGRSSGKWRFRYGASAGSIPPTSPNQAMTASSRGRLAFCVMRRTAVGGWPKGIKRVSLKVFYAGWSLDACEQCQASGAATSAWNLGHEVPGRKQRS